MVDERGVVGRQLLQLLADAAQALPHLGRLAIAGLRQQIENGRAAFEEFGFGGLALGQLRRVELADQPADVALQLFPGRLLDLSGQQRSQQ